MLKREATCIICSETKDGIFSFNSTFLFAAVALLACLCIPAVSNKFYNVRSTTPAFEIVDLPGKGKGIIALRDIQVCAPSIHAIMLIMRVIARGTTHQRGSFNHRASYRYAEASFLCDDLSRSDC